MLPTSVAASHANTTLGQEADAAARALHAEVVWDVAGPRPTRGARRETRGRRELVVHHSVGESAQEK